MALLLCIESSAEVCSVALARDGEVVSLRENGLERQHAKLLAPYIFEVMSEANIRPSQLDAVAVSQGPGSYTSLRIGTSVAKGLCYGAGKPLVAVSSLQSLAMLAVAGGSVLPSDLLCPLLDARRMEVYTALYDARGLPQTDVTAQVVDERTLADRLDAQRILFFGSGAEKCRDVIRHPNAMFLHVPTSARGMVGLAQQRYAQKLLEDVAYFEPFYLKDFVAGVSVKKML
ncbi:MAG: tRNA (adenosine(37)-N6)-threonylcarbamoyltransferase complex dimerization subunit type 1 TsaB [Prevotellaceae bacterium]|jgi:tRNA threonylcarbamoyladenosine biosynthesis protein TsaB|nr:tRNA (adenosine(37)-N6)-threonylcarbamoyltransferase complex dimerization subunit type 1 TsaB [Prevotellaceae bacterium]